MRGAVPGLTQVKEIRVPKGVVGVISPWNYPFYLGVGDVIPALLAGNAVVSKADSQTALTLLHARELMAEAGLPADAWHVVAGPRQRRRHRADRRRSTTSASPGRPAPAAPSASRPAAG